MGIFLERVCRGLFTYVPLTSRQGYKVLTLAHDPTMTTIHISFTYRRPIPSSAGTNAGGKKIDKNAPVSTEQVSVYQHFSVDPRKLETAKIAWSMLRNELFNHEREAIQTGDNAHLQTFVEEQVLNGDTVCNV